MVEPEKEKPEEKEKRKVTILERREFVTYPKLNTPVEQLAITYVAGLLPPRTLFVAKKEWSKEKEAELIRKDIEKAMESKPEEIEV